MPASEADAGRLGAGGDAVGAPTRRTLVGAVLAGIVAFLLVAWGLNTLVRALPIEPDAGVLNFKLGYLAQHAGEFDTIFVGTSRVHFQFDPLVFDTEMARLGCPSRSFNMGVHGLTAAEERHLLRRLTEVGNGRWRWILVERNLLPHRMLRWIGSDRLYYFFGGVTDLELTFLGFWTSWRDPRDNLIDTAHLLLAFLYNQLGPGQLTRLLPGPQDGAVAQENWLRDLSRAGFVPVEREIDPALRARAAEMDREALAERLAETRAYNGRVEPLSSTRAAYLAGQVSRARQVAPNVGFIIFPQAWSYYLDDTRAIEQAAREGRLGEVTLVNLGDPRRHPDIFVERLWYENDHVIGEGAVMLSTYLARELCPQMLAKRR